MKELSHFICLLLTATILTGCTIAGRDKPLTAQGLFDRYIDEAYGRKGLDAQTSITMKGTLTIDAVGISAPITIRQMAPDSVSTAVEIPGASVNSGCRGGDCWDQQPGQGIETLNGARLASALQQADFYQYTHMADYYQSLEIAPAVDGSDSDNHRVRATHENGVDIYYFSKESGMLVRTDIDTPTALGFATLSTNNSKFQEYGGIMLPTETSIVIPNAFTMKVMFKNISFSELSPSDFSR